MANGKIAPVSAPMMKEYLSINEVTEFSGLSRATVYRMMAAGLPFHKVGTRTLIKRSDLIDVIEGRKPKAEAAA